MSQTEDVRTDTESAQVTATDEPATELVAQTRRRGGPKSEAGKLTTCQNARKHSFYAKKLFHPDEEGNEEHQEFTRILTAL